MIQVASNHERDDRLSPAHQHDDLRGVAAAFETAQAQRLRTGEQIRALVQTRGDTRPPHARGTGDIEALLARIRAGAAPAPLASVGDVYRRQWNEERELLRELSERIARHPAWHWLERVRGIGPSLAARLLARLEIDRAPTPSSFWSYCGLATVVARGVPV